MPEEGDTVQLLFPTEDENEAYSNMALRQKDSDKTTDPKIKYLRTPDGKEIKLEKEEILITAKDGKTFIKINETSGVDIITDKAVQINAGGSISVTEGDTISMTSKNDFTINSGKNLNISAADAISMTCRDNSVKLETAASGIEIDAKKPIKMTGGDTVDLTSKGKFTATCKDECKVSADRAMEVSAKGSSIKMDGDIDMKAKLIKEN